MPGTNRPSRGRLRQGLAVIPVGTSQPAVRLSLQWASKKVPGSRRSALALAATLLVTFAGLPRLLAQDYPTRPVKIIVPFGAGPADVAARLFGNILQERFGQPFVVENRTGAGGVTGTLGAAKSPPGGYTLLMLERGMRLTGTDGWSWDAPLPDCSHHSDS